MKKANYTKIRFGFRSKTQMPLFMVWREYYENGEIVFAKVLFEIKGKYRRLYDDSMTELEQLQGYLHYLRLYPLWKNRKERKRIKMKIELLKRPPLICELCKYIHCMNSSDNFSGHVPTRRMLLKNSARPHLICRGFLNPKETPRQRR